MAETTTSENSEQNKAKMTQEKDRERPVRAHDLSSSGSDSDEEFFGYEPISRSKKRSKDPASAKDPTRSKQSRKEDDGQQGGNFPNVQPPWWNQSYPPGPWQQQPQQPWQFMPQMYWPMQGMAMQQNEDDQESDEMGSDSEDETLKIPVPRANDQAAVSLDKHLELASAEEDLGPDANDKVAKLVCKIWDKDQKKGIKEIYAECPRPANVPCLQKVDVDEEIMQDLYKQPVKKELDFAIRGVHHGIIRAANAVTATLSDIFDNKASQQQIADRLVQTLRILSFSAQQTHSLRKKQIKPALQRDVQNKLCSRNASLQDINRSHLLFGGDVPAMAKKGKHQNPKINFLVDTWKFTGSVRTLNHCPLFFSAKESKGLVKSSFLPKSQGYNSPLVPPMQFQQAQFQSFKKFGNNKPGMGRARHQPTRGRHCCS